jgi:hypothetical protein
MAAPCLYCSNPAGAKGRSVPLVRYFVVVSGVLLAMLLVANWYLPSPPAMPNEDPPIDRTTLRIRSERVWPQKVQFDTSIAPFLAPSAPVIAAAAAPANPQKPAPNAMAQAKPPEPQIAKPKLRARVKYRTAPRSPPPIRFAVNPTPPVWSFGW